MLPVWLLLWPCAVTIKVALLPGTAAPDAQGPTAPWTPENSFLTASNKLNRKPIEAGFKEELAKAKAAGIR